MLCSYKDITEKLGTPLWWDEHGVPRYCDFSPSAVADIYAQEAALCVIACQNCGREFAVAITSNAFAKFDDKQSTVRELIEAGTCGWGDPPNIGCCGSGPTMTSDDVRVLQYWALNDRHDWDRDPKLEVAFP